MVRRRHFPASYEELPPSETCYATLVYGPAHVACLAATVGAVLRDVDPARPRVAVTRISEDTRSILTAANDAGPLWTIMEGSEWAECCKHTGRKADLLRIHRCGLIAFLDADALPIASPSLPAAITSLWAMAAALPPSADVIGALHDRFMRHPSCFNSAFMLLRPSRDRYEAYRSLVLRRRVCCCARARRVRSRPNDCACALTHAHLTTHSMIPSAGTRRLSHRPNRPS